MTHGKGDGQPCCPKFDPGPWDGKTHEWKDKPFTMESIPQFLHMPFPPMFARTVTRMWKQAQEAGATPEMKDFLLMAYDPSPWKSELYLAVTKEISGAKNVTLSGTFFTKVFDGPYNAVPRWIKEMASQITAQGKTPKKYYVYFTTCPKCAKTYGHNYAVALAQVE